jgi:thiol:disulfide interchange protein
VNTRLWVVLSAAAVLAAVPVVGSGWQSAGLTNQESTPQASTTSVAPASASLPVSAPADNDTARRARKVEPSKTGITWEQDLRSALKSASEQNRLVVVDVYAPWCGVCRHMDRTIYSDPKVASLSSSVVFLKLNADDKGEGNKFSNQNQVSGLPTTIILDPKGAVINKVVGYIGSPDRFVSMVKSSLARR